MRAPRNRSAGLLAFGGAIGRRAVHRSVCGLHRCHAVDARPSPSEETVVVNSRSVCRPWRGVGSVSWRRPRASRHATTGTRERSFVLLNRPSSSRAIRSITRRGIRSPNSWTSAVATSRSSVGAPAPSPSIQPSPTAACGQHPDMVPCLYVTEAFSTTAGWARAAPDRLRRRHRRAPDRRPPPRGPTPDERRPGRVPRCRRGDALPRRRSHETTGRARVRRRNGAARSAPGSPGTRVSAPQHRRRSTPG